MDRVIAIILLAFLNILIPTANGADSPSSMSKVDGFFFGRLDEAFIGVSYGTSNDFIESIANICRKNYLIWGKGFTKPFRCKNYNDGRIELSKPNEITNINEQDFILFSTKEFRQDTWKVRAAESKEVAEISSFIKINNDEIKIHESDDIKQHIKIDEIIVVESHINRKFYIVLWGISDRDFSQNTKYVVIESASGKLSFARMFDGKIKGYSDIDLNGVPEIHVSMDCDGICEAILPLNSDEVLVDISVH